jgi:hypothetical protein
MAQYNQSYDNSEGYDGRYETVNQFEQYQQYDQQSYNQFDQFDQQHPQGHYNGSQSL